MSHEKGICRVCHTKQDVIDGVIMPHSSEANIVCPGYGVPPEDRKTHRKCTHQHTRCLHGDEINAYSTAYFFRFWKKDVVRRQICTDCGKALDRDAICTVTGRNIHIWNGPWLNE